MISGQQVEQAWLVFSSHHTIPWKYTALAFEINTCGTQLSWVLSRAGHATPCSEDYSGSHRRAHDPPQAEIFKHRCSVIKIVLILN